MHRDRMCLSLLLAGLCLSKELEAQSPPRPVVRDSQTVVFVCEHGTVKSVVAMALFRQMASDRHLAVRAISRGTAPEAAIPAPVRAGLLSDHLDVRNFTPTKFSVSDLEHAITVISFDQPSVVPLVAGRVPTSAWDSLPAVSENYGIARDAIRRRVRHLVDSLARVSPKSEHRP